LSNADKRAPPSNRKKINSFAGIGNAHLINGTTLFLLSTIIALVVMHSIRLAGLDRSHTYRRIAAPRRSTSRFPRRWTKARRPPCILSRICTSPGRRFCTKSRPCSNSPRCPCGLTFSRTSGRFRSPRGSRAPPRRAPDTGFLRDEERKRKKQKKNIYIYICFSLHLQHKYTEMHNDNIHIKYRLYLTRTCCALYKRERVCHPA